MYNRGEHGGGLLHGGIISRENFAFQEGGEIFPLKFRGVGSVVQVLELGDPQGWRSSPPKCSLAKQSPCNPRPPCTIATLRYQLVP